VQFRDTPILVTLTADSLTLAIHPEGVSHPITAGVPGDLRELSAGDQAVFELKQDLTASWPAADG
jgi:hypothetical protein